MYLAIGVFLVVLVLGFALATQSGDDGDGGGYGGGGYGGRGGGGPQKPA